MKLAANRTRALRMAVMSSLLGKGLSAVTQLISFPMAVEALGLERFGVYAMLTAVMMWINAGTALVGSSLTLKIVEAHANEETSREVQLVSTAFLFAIVMAIFLALVLNIGVHYIDLNRLFSLNGSMNEIEVRRAAQCMSILLPLSIVAALADSVYAGYQRQYITNILLSCSNLAVISGLVFVAKYPTIYALIISILLPPVVARASSLAILFIKNPAIFPRFRNAETGILKQLLHLGFGFSLMHIGSFAYLQYTVFSVGHTSGLRVAAYFSCMMQVIAIAGSILILVTQPLLPAITDARMRFQYDWIKAANKRVLIMLCPLIIFSAIIIGMLGNSIISILLKRLVLLSDKELWLWAVFFILVAWEHIGYIFLVGLGRLPLATGLYLSGALIMLLALHCKIFGSGISGVFAAMCLGPLCSTVFIYPWIIRRLIYNNVKLVAFHYCPVKRKSRDQI